MSLIALYLFYYFSKGSLGDVQPYVALGKLLLKDGHRVRIATHETFRSFVTEAGLEFFNIGGNPQDLMSYMVKSWGLCLWPLILTDTALRPWIDARHGISYQWRYWKEAQNAHRGISYESIPQVHWNLPILKMINGCWLSCHSPCPNTGRTFAADAIISNPPAFAHVHCAEALGIPLLLSFSASIILTSRSDISISNHSNAMVWSKFSQLFLEFWFMLCNAVGAPPQTSRIL